MRKARLFVVIILTILMLAPGVSSARGGSRGGWNNSGWRNGSGNSWSWRNGGWNRGWNNNWRWNNGGRVWRNGSNGRVWNGTGGTISPGWGGPYPYSNNYYNYNKSSSVYIFKSTVYGNVY